MRFYKMNGAGNDFIIINGGDECIPRERMPEIAKKVCRRHISLGADGLMAVYESSKADFKMLFFNSDGSEGEMCGNGARCICRYGYETGLSGEKQTVETASGIIEGERLDSRLYKIALTLPKIIDLSRHIEALGEKYTCSYIELGDPGLPHAVLRIDGLREMTFDQLRPLGRAVRYNEAFPKGANVNFYDKDSHGIVIKTFERGVEDFTYACGTGSAATALSLMLKGEAKTDGVKLENHGGVLDVSAVIRDEAVEKLYLAGGAVIVAHGDMDEWEI